MTKEEAKIYFEQCNSRIISVCKDENKYDYEKQEIISNCARRTYEANRLAIQALEQEPCEDCVSRQTLDEIKELMTDINGDTVYAVRMSDLRQLPSVTPKQQTCEDCISRQAAIDCLNADFTIDGKENMETVVDYIKGAFEQIEALPSVTPKQKTGRWVIADNLKEAGHFYKCSECNHILAKSDFCPNCGTKMEVEEC